MFKLFTIFLVFSLDYCSASIWAVPPTSPTRHQLVAGIGIPLQLERESITSGYVFKAQYYLAENANQNKLQKFPDIFAPSDPALNFDTNWMRFPNGGRKRRSILNDPITGQRYEMYEVNVDQVGDEPLNDTKSDNWTSNNIESSYDEDSFDDQFDDDLENVSYDRNHIQQHYVRVDEDTEIDLPRWTIYDAISDYFTTKGLNGRECLLRSICEAKSLPFGDNLFEELLHTFFTPSTTNEQISTQKDNEYLSAENYGKGASVSDCEERYFKCRKSLLEFISDTSDLL